MFFRVSDPLIQELGRVGRITNIRPICGRWFQFQKRHPADELPACQNGQDFLFNVQLASLPGQPMSKPQNGILNQLAAGSPNMAAMASSVRSAIFNALSASLSMTAESSVPR